MSRFGPGVLPQDHRTVDPDGLINALAAYRGFKRQAAQDGIVQNQEARAAESHEFDLYESGYRRGPVPTTEQEIGGPGYTRPSDSPLGPQGDPFAGLSRRPRRTIDAFDKDPDPEPRPFTPGQYVPGLGFQIVAPKIGLQRPPTEPAPDPRYRRVTDDLYFDPSATREGKLQAALGRAGLTDVQAEIGSMERSLIDDFLAGPKPSTNYSVQDLIAAGIEPTDALLAARDPVLARQMLGDRKGAGATYTAEDLQGAGLSAAEVAIAQGDPSQLDNLLSLAERRRAAKVREGRLAGGGGSTVGGTPAQRRAAMVDAAKAMFRQWRDFGPEGVPLNSSDRIQAAAAAMATKFGVQPGDVQGVVSEAAQAVKVERITAIGRSNASGSAADRADEILNRHRTAPGKSALDRAKELAAEGKTPQEIAATLNREKYKRN